MLIDTWPVPSADRRTRERAAVELALDLATTPLGDLSVADVLTWGAGEIGHALGGVAVVLTLDDHDVVRASGWSDEGGEEVARVQEERQSGVGVRAVRAGRRCVVEDVAADPDPAAAAPALRLGLRRSVATPLRRDRHDHVVSGCLQLLWSGEQALTPALLDDLEVLARVLGAVAGNAAAYGDSVRSVARLARVLDERAPVEQAKGMLAERHRIEMTEAFVLLRGYARDHRVSLTQASRQVVGREQPPARPATPGRRRRRRPVN